MHAIPHYSTTVHRVCASLATETGATLFVFYLDFGFDWIRCGATGLNCIDGYFGNETETEGGREGRRASCRRVGER